MMKIALLAVAFAAATLPAMAQQAWPTKPVHIVVPYAAGSSPDVLVRIVSEKLGPRLGQAIVIDNKPGGQNVIGAQAAARSAPDGLTLYYATTAAMVTNSFTFKSLPYDPIKDFTVISKIAEVSFMVLAHPDVPVKNLSELFAYAKAHPDKIAVATDGARRFSGMVAAWLNKLAGTKISYVPYTQMTQGIQDVLAGRVQLVIIAVPAAKGHIAAGKLRPLAVTSLKRLPEFPDVQAVSETFPGFDFAGWFALAAPAGVPAPILDRVNKELAAVLKDSEVVAKMRNVGFVSRGGGTMQQTRDYVMGQYAAWAKLVKEIGLEPE